MVESGRAEDVGDRDGDGTAAMRVVMVETARLGMGGVGEEPFGVEVEEEDEEDDEEEGDDGSEHDVGVVGEDGVDDLGEGGIGVRH